MTPALIAASLLALTAPPAAQAPADPVDALVQSALAAHPSLNAIDAQIDALDHAIAQTSTVPDPIVGVEYSNMPLLTPWPGNHPMSGVQLKLSQKILWPTKLGARADAARAARDALRPSLDEVRNNLESKVRTLAVKWRLTRALRVITVDHIAAIDRLIEAVRVKYEVGRVEQYDLLRLEVLKQKLQDDLTEFDRRADAIAGTLNAVAQRPASAPLELGAQIPIPERGDESVQALLDAAAEDRPLLRRIAAMAHTKRVRAGSLRTEKWPDVTAWLGYRFRAGVGTDPGADFLTAGISVPIPWSSALYGFEEKARSLESDARSDDAKRADALLKIRGDIDSTLVVYKRAKERAAIYRDQLMPGAKKTLEAAFASYQVDRAGFAELYSAELDALNFERVAVRARAEAATASIKLDTLIGRYAKRSAQGDAQ